MAALVLLTSASACTQHTGATSSTVTSNAPLATVKVASGTLVPTISGTVTIRSGASVAVLAPGRGVFDSSLKVGDTVSAQQVLGSVGQTPLSTPVDGIVAAIAPTGAEVPARYPVFAITYTGFAIDLDAARLLHTTGSSAAFSGKFQITDGVGPTACAAVLPARDASAASDSGGAQESGPSNTGVAFQTSPEDSSGDSATATDAAATTTPVAMATVAVTAGTPASVIPISAGDGQPVGGGSDVTDDGTTADKNNGSNTDSGTDSGSGDSGDGSSNGANAGGTGSGTGSSTTMTCLIGKDVDVREGEGGTLVLSAAATAPSLLLPVSAVAGRSGTGTVTRVSDGTQEQVQVTLGASDGARIVIASGLDEGDEVLATAPNLTTKQIPEA